jgi:hypothetical protein
VAGILLRRPVFDPRLVCVGLVMRGLAFLSSALIFHDSIVVPILYNQLALTDAV